MKLDCRKPWVTMFWSGAAFWFEQHAELCVAERCIERGVKDGYNGVLLEIQLCKEAR